MQCCTQKCIDVDFRSLFHDFFQHLLIFSLFILNMHTEYSVYNLVLSFCFLFRVPLVIIHLTATTISCSGGMRAAKEEDKELSFTFFPFPLQNQSLLITLAVTPVITKLLLFLYNETVTATDLHKRAFISRSLTVLPIREEICNCVMHYKSLTQSVPQKTLCSLISAVNIR